MNKPQSSNRIKIYSGFWEEFHLLGISEHDIIRIAKLPVTILIEPVVVTTAQYIAIWKAINELVDDPAEATVKLMSDSKTAQWPIDVLASYHARDYRDAINRIVRYKKLCSPCSDPQKLELKI